MKQNFKQGLVETLSKLSLFYNQLNAYETARDYSKEALLLAREIGHQVSQAKALTLLGQALTGLGLLEEAIAYYWQALTLYRELILYNQVALVLAGLAQTYLLQDNLAQAQTEVDEILEHLESTTSNDSSFALEGILEMLLIYWVCYQVLQANEDERAETILQTAHTLLQKQATKIDDKALKLSFLENVSVS